MAAGFFSLAPTYPSLGATPPFPGPVSGPPGLGGATPPFPGPSSFVKTDGIHDEGDSRETITHNVALAMDSAMDIEARTGLNHLAFLRDATPLSSRYRYGELYHQYLPNTVSSLNHYLTTPEGRKEFGSSSDAFGLMNTWRFAGVQQTAIPPILRDVQDHSVAYAIGKRVRIPNIWLLPGDSIRTLDTVWLLVRRYPWRPESEHDSLSERKEARVRPLISERHSKAKEGIDSLVSSFIKEMKEEEKPSSSSSSSGAVGAHRVITAAIKDIPVRKPFSLDADEYFWQFEPYVTHGNESPPYGLWNSTGNYIGAAIRVGIVTELFGRKDSISRSKRLLRQMLFPTDPTDRYKSVCPDLPEIEVMLRVNG
jgi:hypothetical protein